jgi:hypothetical protein
VILIRLIRLIRLGGKILFFSLISPNFPERITKTAQVLSRLNENFFDFFDFAVKKFCGSGLVVGGGEAFGSIAALGRFVYAFINLR